MCVCAFDAPRPPTEQRVLISSHQFYDGYPTTHCRAGASLLRHARHYFVPLSLRERGAAHKYFRICNSIYLLWFRVNEWMNEWKAPPNTMQYEREATMYVYVRRRKGNCFVCYDSRMTEAALNDWRRIKTEGRAMFYYVICAANLLFTNRLPALMQNIKVATCVCVRCGWMGGWAWERITFIISNLNSIQNSNYISSIIRIAFNLMASHASCLWIWWYIFIPEQITHILYSPHSSMGFGWWGHRRRLCFRIGYIVELL